MADVSKQIRSLETDHSTHSSNLSSQKNQSMRPVRKECEILLTGLPSPPLCNSPDEEINAFLNAIGLSRVTSTVLRVRQWVPSMCPNQPHTSRFLVFQHSSLVARDLVVSNGYKLQTFTHGTVFGGNSPAKFTLRPLWPRLIHTLLQKACVSPSQLSTINSD